MDNAILDQVISEAKYCKIGKKTTVCCLLLKNGYEISATSCAGRLEDFNEEREST